MELTLDDTKDSALIRGIIAVLLPDLRKELSVKEELLTVQQLNEEYYHISNEAMAAIVRQKGYPSCDIPGNKNPKYSRRAVEKYIAEHQDYHN